MSEFSGILTARENLSVELSALNTELDRVEILLRARTVKIRAVKPLSAGSLVWDTIEDQGPWSLCYETGSPAELDRRALCRAPYVIRIEALENIEAFLEAIKAAMLAMSERSAKARYNARQILRDLEQKP